MKKYLLIPTAVLILTVAHKQTIAQTYPTFGNEISVTINGLTFDAMEPFISVDGNYLFFNSLNNSVTTSLYYATKVNDSVFTYIGPLSGANQTITPYLDAVPSCDSANNFFWTSLRDFPSQMENCFHGSFTGTDVLSIGRLHGTLYIYSAGWIMMDASINYNGNLLYYTNAYFGPTYAGSGGMPCQGKLGIAQKQNDSTFNKLSNSDNILQNVNDTINYVIYAPFLTKDELELYYTRVLHTPTQSEICVSVRNSITDTFSLPSVIYASSLNPEGPTLTTDKLKMYYHKKSGTIFKIFLRYRTSPIGIKESENIQEITVFPNPFSTQTTFHSDNFLNNATLTVYNLYGQQVKQIKNISGQTVVLFRDNLSSGLYFVHLTQDKKVIATQKIIIAD